MSQNQPPYVCVLWWCSSNYHRYWSIVSKGLLLTSGFKRSSLWCMMLRSYKNLTPFTYTIQLCTFKTFLCKYMCTLSSSTIVICTSNRKVESIVAKKTSARYLIFIIWKLIQSTFVLMIFAWYNMRRISKRLRLFHFGVCTNLQEHST